MDILEKAAQLEAAGHSVVHLEIGQPDFNTPECIAEAAIAAVRDGKTGYTPSLGIMPLREAVAEYYFENYGVTVSPEQVVITDGTSPGMMLLFSVLCGQGDTVLMPTPSYPCYEGFVRFAGASSIRVPSEEANGFQLDPAAARRAVRPNTKAILVNSPSNPAGTLVSLESLKELAAIGPTLVSDEIYHGLVYEGKAHSALEASPEACVLDGFSKRYAMTGWRLGWLIVPERLIPLLRTLQQNFFISPNSISQWAGLAALKYAKPDVERMAAEYNRRRLLLIARLRELGFGVNSSPAGAFYVLANARHLGEDSLALAFDILEKAKVGVAPGIDFGCEAEGYLRFSYASSVENIEEAMRRLKLYIERR